MFTLHAKDARQLQKDGIPREAIFSKAVDRCQNAIIDQSSKGHSQVEVAVTFLKDGEFEKLVEQIEEAGFTVDKNAEKFGRYNPNTHVVMIVWG